MLRPSAVRLSILWTLSGFGQDLVFLDTGSINGQTVDSLQDTISVRPGQPIQGTFEIDVFNDEPAASITPVGAMVTWGDRELRYWSIDSNANPGSTHYFVTIDETAPLEPGEYYVMVGIAPRFTVEQVLSATSAPCAPAIWNDGNDLGWNWSRKEFRESRDLGYTTVLTRDGACTGYQPQVRGATWLRIVVECPADVTGDGHVNISDLGVLLSEFGATCDGAEGRLVRWDGHPDGKTHWYEAVLEVGTWTQAEGKAQERSYQDMQGHLATITSQAENDLLFALIQPLADERGDFWIGAHQPDDDPCQFDTGWVWVTGEPWGYANWAPSVFMGDGCDSYGQMGHAGEWGDRDNDDLRDNFGYLVEYSE